MEPSKRSRVFKDPEQRKWALIGVTIAIVFSVIVLWTGRKFIGKMAIRGPGQPAPHESSSR